MRALEIRSPVDLAVLRKDFEKVFNGRDFREEDISSNLTIVGFVSSYQRLQLDPDSVQVFLNVSQGSNEEFRFTYTGNKYVLSLERHPFSAVVHLVFLFF